MRVALYGDSQAQGLEAPLRALLETAGHQLVHVSAHQGASTARMYSEGWLDGPAVDVAIVALGGNDGPPATYRDILLRAAERLRRNARQVIWIGPMWSTRADVDERHERAATVQRAVLPQLGVAWSSGRAISQGRELAPDGVHFTRDGYKTIAAAVAEKLAPTSNTAVLVIGTLSVAAAALVVSMLVAEALSE